MRAALKVLAGALALFVASEMGAQDAGAPPRVEDVLKRASAHLDSLQTVRFHAEVNFDDALPSGTKIQYAGAIDIAARRGGQLFVDYRDDLSARRLWVDDGVFTLLDPIRGFFATHRSPGPVLGLLDEMEARFGVTAPLAILIVPDFQSVVLARTQRRRWVGLHDVEGIACHHLALRGKTADWQVWVEDGEIPWVRKAVVTHRNLPGAPQFVAVLMDWEADPELPADLFEPELGDAMEIEFLEIGGRDQ